MSTIQTNDQKLSNGAIILNKKLIIRAKNVK